MKEELLLNGEDLIIGCYYQRGNNILKFKGKTKNIIETYPKKYSHEYVFDIFNDNKISELILICNPSFYCYTNVNKKELEIKIKLLQKELKYLQNI